MPLQTDRLSLPLLAAAQAQKEMTHNEALTVLDVLVQPVVIAVAPTTLPAAPTRGQAWIVGPGATGAWAGRDGNLAAWTAGGWRFVEPHEGTTVWSLADAMPVRRTATTWTIGTLAGSALILGGVQVVGAQAGAITAPSGGATIDSEARVAVASILGILRSHGLIAS